MGIIEKEIGVTVIDLLNMKDSVVKDATDRFVDGEYNFDEFKRIVFDRLHEVTGKNKLTDAYDRAMRGI